MEPLASPNDLTDISSNHAALQHMYELESIKWRGGDLHWDGPHNEFCEVCGGSKELFGCQTCNMSYHSDCMSPTLEDDEVPTFWFCPHCVNNNFHIPPESPTTYFTPVSIPGQLASQTSYFTPISDIASIKSPIQATQSIDKVYPTPQTPFLHPSEQMKDIEETEDQPYNNHQRQQENFGSLSNRTHPDRTFPNKEVNREVGQPQVKRGRPKRAQSPPKKKSKYSAFSADVDKALAVITSELEAAAENGRSESNLHDKIRSLEQQLKLQSGQMALMRGELERVKRDLDIERFKVGRLEGVARGPNEEITRLRDLVATKDAELNDWRTKLKSLIGS